MKLALLVILFLSELTYATLIYSENLSFTYNFKPEVVYGITSMIQDSASQKESSIPRYNWTTLLGQELGAVVPAMIGATVGAGVGLVLNSFNSTKNMKQETFKGLGALITGGFAGYILTKSYFIYKIGNAPQFEGNYWVTLGVYSVSFIFITSQTSISTFKQFVLTDIFSTALASFAHYFTLQKKDQQSKVVSIAPSFLKGPDQLVSSAISLRIHF